MYKIMISLVAITIFLCSGCKKFLDKKPSASLVVPATARDAQALLDNSTLLNASWPFNLELASDDIILSTTDWLGRSLNERNTYIWAENVFNEQEINGWSNTYTIVYTSNVVLDEIRKGLRGSKEELDNIRGQALFFRAFAFYNLLQLFAPPYNAATAGNQLGIPLRLDSDFNKPTTRARLSESWNQVVNDLQQALPLLPNRQSVLTRPSKQAVYTLLARVAMHMGDYASMRMYAVEALQIDNRLLNFNSLNENAARPITIFNAEVHFHSTLISALSVIVLGRVDTILFNSYHINDRRRLVNFSINTDGSRTFKAGFEGSGRAFNGFTNGELYLMKAEAEARLGNISDAMSTLNSFLITRYRTGTFIPLTAANRDDAILKIIDERRKELLFRGIRWTDLRRLNQDPLTARVIRRRVNNTEYILEPNSPRYTFKIPELVIRITGIQQND